MATHEQRKAAVVRAGNLYYSQWAARFRSHGLTTSTRHRRPRVRRQRLVAGWKRDLLSTYRDVWAKHFTTKPNGEPKFPVRPRGSVHESTAYAWRPRPDVQMISLDEFTLRDDRMQLEIDQKQQAWLVRVLKKARADGVRWTLVQGHLPILGPVRQGASSGLNYHGGQQSRLWQIFKKYGVDVYLCGEVHDVTAIQRDGVLQLSHGGIFQFGRLNYLIADFYPNHLDLRIFDYEFNRAGDRHALGDRDPHARRHHLRAPPRDHRDGTAVAERPAHSAQRRAGAVPALTAGHSHVLVAARTVHERRYVGPKSVDRSHKRAPGAGSCSSRRVRVTSLRDGAPFRDVDRDVAEYR